MPKIISYKNLYLTMIARLLNIKLFYCFVLGLYV